MKIIISAIAFLTTIGGLFLFDGRKPNTATDYAQIVKNISESASPSISVVSNKTVKHSSSPSPSVSIIPPATLAPSLTPSLAPTFIPTPFRTPTPSPTPTLTSTPIPAETTIPVITMTPTPLAQSALININTANAAELDKITGIGPAYAKNIIDYRTVNGPFQKIEDIINVKGIGPKTFESMKNEITV